MFGVKAIDQVNITKTAARVAQAVQMVRISPLENNMTDKPTDGIVVIEGNDGFLGNLVSDFSALLGHQLTTSSALGSKTPKPPTAWAWSASTAGASGGRSKGRGSTKRCSRKI